MKIFTACALAVGVLLSANSFAYHGHGYHHGYYHGYHHGYYGHWHGYHNRYYYGYGGGYWGAPIVAAPVYYSTCRWIRHCNRHHCWSTKVC